MSFLNSVIAFFSEYLFVILFYSFIVIGVYLNRKKLSKEGTFMYLYKTKLGLGLMDWAGKKFNGFIKAFGYFSVILGYLGFIFVTYVLINNAYDLIIQKPGALGGSPVIPGLPIAGLGITFPLIIGWISLFIIMIVHEFSHGVVARAHNLKVKSSGLAFFGPILGAFVEPDEKQIVKQSYWVQNSVFSAGPISNIVLWLVCMMIMFGITPIFASIYYGSLQAAGVNATMPNTENMPFAFSLATVITANSKESGIMVNTIKNESYPAFSAGLPERSVIVEVNDKTVANFSDFLSAMENVKPEDKVNLKTKSGESYDLVAVKNPSNESLGFIGVTNFEQDRMPKDEGFFSKYYLMLLLWLFELLWWTQFISLNIGLINLFPIFITDGARILKTNIDAIVGDKKRAAKIFNAINITGLFVIGVMLLLPLARNIVKVILSVFLGFL
jgi:membrane-associated protease RseP (regulator of RpoE activity)